MFKFKGRTLKGVFSIDTHIIASSGETQYTVCDNVGVIYTTIFEANLEGFFV